MSDSRAFSKLLFLIFDVPTLYSSGTCLIPSSTSFFPNSEFSALAPTPSPFFSRPGDVSALAHSFAMFPKRLPPCCVLRFLYLLGLICPVLVMVTFLGKTFPLTLSYPARKDSQFGNITYRGATHRLNNIFCIGFSTAVQSSFFSTKDFFHYRFC